jgi:outer membrane protein TolC
LDGGKRVAELAAARARLRSSAAIEQQRRADIAFAVRNTYSTALAFHSESDIRSEAVRVLTNYLDLLRRQEQLGLVPVGDAVRAELALQTARSAERAAVAGLDAALHELGVLVGSPLAPADDEAIERSPAVLDARAAADAARSDADAVRSENRGRLTLSGDAGFLGVNPAPTFRDNGGGEFLVAVSIPLFDGGAVAARVAAATAATARADAKVDQERETLIISLAHLRADAERARTDMDAWSSALPAAAEAFLLLRARYLGGGSTRLLDVLDALNQSIDARLAVVRARFAYRVAAASHGQALGRIEP